VETPLPKTASYLIKKLVAISSNIRAGDKGNLDFGQANGYSVVFLQRVFKDVLP
jgi:hypothetical protein